jgi:hypothetical protein
MGCQEKRLYITEREAIQALLRVRKQHGTRQRHYECDRCRGWHLTSRLFGYQNQADFGYEVSRQDWLD